MKLISLLHGNIDYSISKKVVMNVIQKLRYSRLFSQIARKPSKIFVSIATSMVRQIHRKIKINTGEINYNGYRIKYPENVGIASLSNIYWKGEVGFEPATGKVLIELFQNCNVFLDVGSNYGFYSVLAKKVNPGIEVAAFEPNALMALQNDMFRAANGLEFTLIRKGVSDISTTMKLFVPARDGLKEIGTSSFKEDFYYTSGATKNAVDVECITLDEYWAKHMLEKRGTRACMKIDVEGFEFNVLNGSKTLIETIRPLIVCEVDFTAKNSHHVFSFLTERKYTIYLIQASGLIKLSIVDFNTNFGRDHDFLFLPNEMAIDKAFIPTKYFKELRFG